MQESIIRTLRLHFANNGNERRAETLKPTFPTTFIRIIAFIFVVVFLNIHSVFAETGPSVQVPDVQVQDKGIALLIQNRINELETSSKTVIGGEQIYSLFPVKNFYKGRNYYPGWSRNLHLVQTDTLIKALEDAYGDGLSLVAEAHY